MENLGKYFLDLRVKRDLSYKRLWEDIRVREELIRKIGANKLFDLGGYGVAKAIVYNYARYLEAEIDAVMHEFAIMLLDTTKDKFLPHHMQKEKKIMLNPDIDKAKSLFRDPSKTVHLQWLLEHNRNKSKQYESR